MIPPHLVEEAFPALGPMVLDVSDVGFHHAVVQPLIKNLLWTVQSFKQANY